MACNQKHHSKLFVPKMKSAVHNTQPVWFDNTIRHQIKCLRTMRRKVKQRFSLDKLKRLQEAEDKLPRSIVMARVNYENKLINDFSKRKNYTVYKYIRDTTKTRSIPELMYFNTQCGSCDEENANLFNEFSIQFLLKVLLTQIILITLLLMCLHHLLN